VASSHPADPASDGVADRSRWLHREILQLALLIAVAVGAFFLTRAIAASNGAMNLQHGVEWYERGQRQLAAGDLDGAADSFRRAAVRNRNEKRYALALARALAGQGRNETARTALLAMRESAPEDRDINLRLARLAVARQETPEAVRYFHDTLYAPWPGEQAAARRSVRLELIRFLLAGQETAAAVSEIVALGTDLPDEAAWHATLGDLFAQAGDDRRALEAFERAVTLDPDAANALAGAGRAAFQIGDYALARRYLRAARDAGHPGDGTLEVVELVLTRDPLAGRIGAAARRQRFTELLSYARERLNSCIESRAAADGLPSDELGLRQETDAFDDALTPAALRDEAVIEEGLALVFRSTQIVADRCPPATPLDRALLLMERVHGADPP
jgi:tetratricopeptide (TPR) repeat protein